EVPMVRNCFTKLLSLSIVLITFSPVYGLAQQKIDRCLWSYANINSKVDIINNIAIKNLSERKQLTAKTSRGDLISYNFIPGSLDKEPVVVNGGLWYKIQYFDGFNNLLTAQSLLKETLFSEAQRHNEDLNYLIASGHPIIIVSRSTQPESIYNSLKENVIPSHVNTLATGFKLSKIKRSSLSQKNISLEDHAKDVHDIIMDLRSRGLVGKNKKIELASLSYGVSPEKEFKRLYPDLIIHASIIAPLASAGDNYPDATAIQNMMIKNSQVMTAPLKLNPLTYFWGQFLSEYTKNTIYGMSAKTYSKQIVDGAFSADPEMQARETEFPGYKEMVRQGLENDMNAARPDRFNLADEKDFPLFKNTTIYLAGAEEIDRLRAQVNAWLKMKEKLGNEAPNLVFMASAQHAITATAPIQTAHILSTFFLNHQINQDKTSTDGSVYYMNRLDSKSQIMSLTPELVEVLVKEINSDTFKATSISALETIFFPEIFATRLQMLGLSAKDLAMALAQEKKQDQPADYKEDPSRPYQKYLYQDISQEVREALNQEVVKLTEAMKEYQKIQEKGQEIIKQIQDKKQ
ncbi:MAG: hypothetical protein KDD45_10445, partial [Bdellovibrionales bacterium]|nr:hypothetical protein [Bdellovibrionales bacterium]